MEQFKKAQCELHQLLDFKELIAQAREKENIGYDQFLMLQTWHDDPFNWARKNGFVAKLD